MIALSKIMLEKLDNHVQKNEINTAHPTTQKSIQNI